MGSKHLTCPYLCTVIYIIIEFFIPSDTLGWSSTSETTWPLFMPSPNITRITPTLKNCLCPNWAPWKSACHHFITLDLKSALEPHHHHHPPPPILLLKVHIYCILFNEAHLWAIHSTAHFMNWHSLQFVTDSTIGLMVIKFAFIFGVSKKSLIDRKLCVDEWHNDITEFSREKSAQARWCPYSLTCWQDSVSDSIIRAGWFLVYMIGVHIGRPNELVCKFAIYSYLKISLTNN